MSGAGPATTTVARNARGWLFAGGRALLDGAMGTMLHDRGISFDRCYDELNLSQPETIASIHCEYLLSGAEIIETNTFGSNAFRLERHGLRDKVHEINLAGARIARHCVRWIMSKQATEILVAGAIGPLGGQVERLGSAGLVDARNAFAQQIRALAEGGPGTGVDLLVLETMTSLAEASQAVLAARDVAPGLRIVAMMTVDEDGNCLDGASAEAAAVWLAEVGVDAVGCNCSHGPANVLSAIRRMRAVTILPLAAMPNAGLPRKLEGRSIYNVSPEEMADFAREAVVAGATLIGGCCGTTPEHIRAMKPVLRG